VNGYLGVILTLHRVCFKEHPYKSESIKNLFVTVDRLDQSIQFFKDRGYEILSLDEMFTAVSKKTLNQKFVVFTFDDGYVDNYEIALPVFRKHNVPISIYITTGLINRTIPLWHFILDEIVYSLESIEFQHDGKQYNLDLRSKGQKKSGYLQLASIVNNVAIERQKELLDLLFSKYGYDFVAYSEKHVLSWKTLATMSTDPLVTIGSHSVNHYEFARLNENEVRREMLDSKYELEDKLRKNVDHFAYPFGCSPAINRREIEIARQCSFKTCTTTRPGFVCVEHCDFLDSLPRINLTQDFEKAFLDISFRSHMDGILGRPHKVVTL
jgi:peptidoglycan/xylan/chitin deacetylase (PgdA/CDA1 family)